METSEKTSYKDICAEKVPKFGLVCICESQILRCLNMRQQNTTFSSIFLLHVLKNSPASFFCSSVKNVASHVCVFTHSACKASSEPQHEEGRATNKPVIVLGKWQRCGELPKHLR